jgi:hypothetical protein
MGIFSALNLWGKLTADLAKAKLALPVCIETAEKMRSEAARLRCLEVDAARLGAPDIFLDAVRRMIESFESIEMMNEEAAVWCQKVADVTKETPVNPDIAMAVITIFNMKIDAANTARARGLEVAAETRPGWLAGAKVMQALGAPGWDKLAG